MKIDDSDTEEVDEMNNINNDHDVVSSIDDFVLFNSQTENIMSVTINL